MRNDSHGGGHGHESPRDNVDLLAQMGYETRDVVLGSLGRWLIFLFIFIAAMTAAGWVAYLVFVPKYAQMEHDAPLAHLKKVPPYPQLQADPRRDMNEYRQAEANVVNGFASDGTMGAGAKNPLSISAAMDTLANDRGIAGVRGNSVEQESAAYPGSGLYTDDKPRAEKPQTGDMSGPSATNGLTEGTPETRVPSESKTGTNGAAMPVPESVGGAR